MTKNTKTFSKKLVESVAPAWSTFRLFNSYFFKTIYGPILAFVFPSLILAILGNILRIEYVLPGIIAMSSMFIAVQAMPLGIMEMKNSTLFKYIGASPMSSKKFSLVIIFYYIFIDFVAILIILLMAAALFHNKVFVEGHITNPGALFSGILTPFGFFSFMSANLIHMALGLAIGITIATLSKTPQQALTIGLIIVIPSMFLSGMVITVDVIAQSDTMQWISRLMPFRYTTGNIIISTTPLNQIGDFFNVISLAEKETIFNLTNPKGDPNSYLWIDPASLSADASYLTLTPEQLSNGIVLHNTGEIMSAYAAHPNWFLVTDPITGELRSGIAQTGMHPIVSDAGLFSQIFVKGHLESMANSDNNMYNFLHPFGVRKTPDMDVVTAFLQEYLGKGITQSPSGTGIDASDGMIKLGESISKGKFEWMNLFTKQTLPLYSIAERALNIFLPLVISGGLMFWSYKKFKWTSR